MRFVIDKSINLTKKLCLFMLLPLAINSAQMPGALSETISIHGEKVVVIGSKGCGKTTFIDIMQAEPDEAAGLPAHLKARVSIGETSFCESVELLPSEQLSSDMTDSASDDDRIKSLLRQGKVKILWLIAYSTLQNVGQEPGEFIGLLTKVVSYIDISLDHGNSIALIVTKCPSTIVLSKAKNHLRRLLRSDLELKQEIKELLTQIVKLDHIRLMHAPDDHESFETSQLVQIDKCLVMELLLRMKFADLRYIYNIL